MSKGNSYRVLRSEGDFKDCSLPEMNCLYCRKKTYSKNGMSRHLQHCHPHLYQGRRILQRVTEGTELEGEVHEGVICGVCWLRVERQGYAGHMAAHLEIAQLEVGFLPRLLGHRSRASS